MGLKAMQMISPTGENLALPLRRLRQEGFTLIELILVLALVVMLAGIASPMLGNFARGRTTLDTAGHLLAIMQYAQDQASTGHGAYRLYIDPSKGTYWLMAAPQGAWQKVSSEIGRSFTVPEYISLDLRGTQDLMTNGYIQFEPDGSHDMAAILLGDAQGQQVVIGCASPAEPYRIGRLSELQEGAL